MALNADIRRVDGILAEIKRGCENDADEAARGRCAAVALRWIAAEGIDIGDPDVVSRLSAAFSRDVGELAADDGARAIRKAMGK